MSNNLVFDEMSNYYDRYRLKYPDEMIRHIIDMTGLDLTSRVLEIGAGSGKATEQFADYGFYMLCVEPGNDLAEKGKCKFSGKNIEYIISLFEECDLQTSYFDAVISAQAFHWVKKPDAYELCHRCLKKNGFLVPFWNIEIIRDSKIDSAVFDIIKKYDAYTAVMEDAAYKKRVETISADIKNSGFFYEPEIIQIEWEHCFTAEELYGYFMTGNVFVRNSEQKKQDCYRELVKLEAEYGCIQRTFISEAYIAGRKD